MSAARFLVLRGGAIGDFIVTLPALAALRARWPDAHIELVGYPHIANLALAGGLVDHVESLDRAEMARFFSASPAFTEAQSTYIRSFDLVLCYLHDPYGIVEENLLLAGARQVIYGPPIVEKGPASRHLLKPLESLAIYPDDDIPHLVLSASGIQRGRAWLAERGLGEGVVVLHPGSGSPKKNWPLENFLALAREWTARGPSVLFVVGEADQAIRSRLQEMNPPPALLADATLVEVAESVSTARLYVGNDSGVSHLAAALGVPTVVLFGPSDAAIWAPRGAHVRVLQAPEGDLSRLDVNAVLAQCPRP